MSGPAPGYRTGDAQWSGKIPVVINSPVMSLSSAAANQGAFCAPCDLEIVEILYNLIQAPDGSAADFNIGIRGNNDAFVDAYTIGTSDVTGLYVVDLDDAQVISTSISKGDVVEFDTEGEASSAGLVAITLICMPRNPA